MIQKKPAFVTSDGTVHATLELAQRAELQRPIEEPWPADSTERVCGPTLANAVAELIVTRRAEFIAILCATGRKARVSTKKVRVVRRRKADGLVIDVEKAGGDK